MDTAVVVIPNEFLHAFSQRISVLGWAKINIFLFQGVPEPLNPDIVKRSAFSVHADGDILLFKVFDPSGTSELGALVGVHNLGLAMRGNSLTGYFGDMHPLISVIPTQFVA